MRQKLLFSTFPTSPAYRFQADPGGSWELGAIKGRAGVVWLSAPCPSGCQGSRGMLGNESGRCEKEEGRWWQDTRRPGRENLSSPVLGIS